MFGERFSSPRKFSVPKKVLRTSAYRVLGLIRYNQAARTRNSGPTVSAWVFGPRRTERIEKHAPAKLGLVEEDGIVTNRASGVGIEVTCKSRAGDLAPDTESINNPVNLGRWCPNSGSIAPTAA